MAGASHTAHLEHTARVVAAVRCFRKTLVAAMRRRRHKPADEGFDAFPSDGRHAHGHWLGGGEPVRVVVTGGEVAHVVDVTEEEGHRAELPQAATSRA